VALRLELAVKSVWAWCFKPKSNEAARNFFFLGCFPNGRVSKKGKYKLDRITGLLARGWPIPPFQRGAVAQERGSVELILRLGDGLLEGVEHHRRPSTGQIPEALSKIMGFSWGLHWA